MPANIEYQLLAKVIDEGNMYAVHKEGITEDYFFVVEARALFSYLADYYQGSKTRNMVPERELVLKKFPSVDLPTPSDRHTIPSLCYEMKQEYLRVKIEGIANKLEKTYVEDPSGALSRLVQDSKALLGVAEESRDILLAESGEAMKREYLLKESSQGMVGIPWPVGWGLHTDLGKPDISEETGRQKHPLNEQSGGMQKGEFILFYGRPKSMKTWILMDLAAECYYHLNQRVLVFTKEMTPEQLRWRIVARMQGVNYAALKTGKLPPEERDEFFDLVDNLKSEEERMTSFGHNRAMLVTTGWQRESVQSGLQSLQSKIEEFEPDIVLADAVYRMKATRNKDGGAIWQDIHEIAYGLHDLAVEYSLPIVATSQANRKGEELKGTSLAEIAYGDTFGQACDYAIRVLKTDAAGGRKFLSLIFTAAREIDIPGIRLEVSLAERIILDQVFETPRQIQAQLKAEEAAILQEEEEAAKHVQRRLDLSKLEQP